MLVWGSFFAIVVVLGVVNGAVDPLPWDDKCRLSYASDLQIAVPATIDVVMPTDCQRGEIDWHYPRGGLHLIMKTTSGYALCIEESWATDLGGIYDVTNGGKTQLAIPTQDNPTCVRDVNGNVEILLLSPQDQLYMTTFGFHTIPQRG